jgi:hypothetical protein
MHMALFDFETQAGITHVLASIRASKISPAQKNELRDIVFLYANGGHDQSVKLALEQKLAAYVVEALPNARFAPKAPTYTIGGTRQPPVDFAVVNTAKIATPPPIITPPPVAPQPAPYVPPAPVVPPPPVIPVALPIPVAPPQTAPYVPPLQAVPVAQPIAVALLRPLPQKIVIVENKVAPIAQPKPVITLSQEDRSDAWESTKLSTSAFADSKLASLAESKLRAQPVSVPVATSSAPTDPLLSPEIDSGLDQLLSEWSLFKKSGLFGTGPKGREHPLFKKVATLQIPLLLAGRFEGATQEIKQSITDYMNGWRYEQGIIYMPGETFERYLRRVIRHILDLQKKPSRT